MSYLIIYLIVALFLVSVPFLSIWIIDNMGDTNLAKFINKHIIYNQDYEKKLK
jgi:hypothetical protein